MSDAKIGRRDAAKRALTVLGAAVIAPSALIGCGGEEEGGGALTCTDTSGLEAAQIATREAQSYTDSSTNADQNCANCNFYQAGQADACGTCQVIQGPIHPDGYCGLWAATA